MNDVPYATPSILRSRPVAAGHLRAFLAVARHLNFRAAADELALTQSAVSRQIQALEDEVGVPLFLRHTRAVELTSAGAQMQRAVAPALERIDTAVRQVTEKHVVPVVFRLEPERFDELLKGYMHVRINNTMVVTDRADPPGDVFERTDDYYLYFKPDRVTEAEVRRRNGWAEGSVVPGWMAMQAH